MTWTDLFAGSNIYSDVFAAYPNLYTQAVEQGSVFDFYIQFILSIPRDIVLLAAVFYGSLLTLTLLVAVVYSLFMPVLNRPRRLL